MAFLFFAVDAMKKIIRRTSQWKNKKKNETERERERVESVAVVVVVVVASVVPARRNRPANRIVCVEERKKKTIDFAFTGVWL